MEKKNSLTILSCYCISHQQLKVDIYVIGQNGEFDLSLKITSHLHSFTNLMKIWMRRRDMLTFM